MTRALSAGIGFETMNELPAPYLQRMQQLLGNEYPEFLASYNHPPNAGLRVNTLKIAPDDLRARVPFDLQPITGATHFPSQVQT
jgi:16S rRNA C967 or C1407 C5-methylase (RsmB/RsmF family)